MVTTTKKSAAPKIVASREAAKVPPAKKIAKKVAPEPAAKTAPKAASSSAQKPAKATPAAKAAASPATKSGGKAPAAKPAAKQKPEKAVATTKAASAVAKGGAPASGAATKGSGAGSAPAKTAKAASHVRKTPAAPGRPAVGLGAKAPAPKRVSEGYVKDERFLASQRAALERERVTYLEQAASLKAEAESLVEEMEPGDIQFDDESGEGGTVTVDRERDLALSAQAMAAVEEIDHALAKMNNGTYGICENCGKLIPKARLEALPYARLCIDCKSGGLSRR